MAEIKIEQKNRFGRGCWLAYHRCIVCIFSGVS
jgi:hypothetical protein